MIALDLGVLARDSVLEITSASTLLLLAVDENDTGGVTEVKLSKPVTSSLSGVVCRL